MTERPDRDIAAVQGWLAGQGISDRITAMERIEGGQSNPTYRLRTEGGDYILRRKPGGPLLPKAHMIEREYRVVSALRDSDVPVARTIGYCDDVSLIGSAFYVMAFVEGRIFWDPRLPGMEKAERGALFDAMNATVAALHAVDPAAVGLGDYGRPEGFMARQMALWTAQYRAAEMRKIPAMDALIAEIPPRLRESGHGGIFHGDLRMDNMIFHPTEPRVLALLDWELSTLGDPIADLAYHMLVWRVPPSLFRGMAGIDFAGLGVPDEAAYLAAYQARTGRDVGDWGAYLAFGLFRGAAILQGIAKRAEQGNANASDAHTMGARVEPIAEIALAALRGGEF